MPVDDLMRDVSVSEKLDDTILIHHVQERPCRIAVLVLLPQSHLFRIFVCEVHDVVFVEIHDAHKENGGPLHDRLRVGRFGFGLAAAPGGALSG